MISNKFSEEDKKKVVEFLNLIAEKAEFKLNTQDVIKYFKLLAFMQQELLPKINANILEIKAIHESKED
jgi:hypothetical protein